MSFYTDLHIHTCLSSCAEDEMTPNNIVNMAKLKGLDVIAITDHNSAQNCLAVMECAINAGLKVIPGMEIETAEEVHLICLFKCLEDALFMDQKVRESLPNIKNNIDIFGHQLVMNRKDEVVCEYEKLLSTACRLSVYDVFELCKNMSAICIPAHINRQSHSIISNLGFIPEELEFKYVEVNGELNFESPLFSKSHLEKYIQINSSDAHFLSQILERSFCIDGIPGII